jgi:hypothetical protein
MIVTSAVFEVLPKHVVPELEKVGFEDVKIWFYEDELPDDWPEDKRVDVSEFGETQVYLQGVWKGKDDVAVPDSGEKWRAYDIWEYQRSGEGEVYGTRQSTLSKALYAGGWALGVFLVGLPIVLAATASEKD